MPPIETQPEAQRIEAAEQFFDHVGAEVRHGGHRAFYNPAHDFIQLPPFALFRETAAYYATLGHECIHWSGAPHRLNRDLKGRFGEEAYAAEELVAELGAAFLCADLGIANEPRPDHAAYVENWLSVLRNDKRAIFTAASKAQAAVDWMHDRQPEASPVSEARRRHLVVTCGRRVACQENVSVPGCCAVAISDPEICAYSGDVNRAFRRI